MLKEKVLKTIKENNLIKKGNKIILGISGGPDSVCLFNILYSLRKKLGIKIILAHVNYNFREQDSLLDEQFVRNLAKKYRTKLYCKNIKPESYKKDVSELNSRYRELSSCAKNLEEYFREIRYEFFNKILKLEKANRIVVAHNKDDQAETILMHFLRGSGLSGLSGMKIENNKIIRPLLNIDKSEILAYLKKNKIEYREDKTNKDIKFRRNKIRHQLIPCLEKNYNLNIKNILFENSNIIKDDNDLISDLTKDLYKKLVKKDKEEYKINLKKFNNLHPALKRRLLKYILNEKFCKEVSLPIIKEILILLQNSKSGSKKYLKDIEIIKIYDKIVIRKKNQLAVFKKIGLKVNGETEISKFNIKFRTRQVDRCGRISKNRCYIDLSKTGRKLFIRTRRKGDRFYPQGLGGSQKIKDFFINKKIDLDKRDLVPLIVNNKDEIAWIGEYRGDRRFQANKNSKDILEIKLFKI